MAPPAAGPLIHGSTTPIANDTATAASTASPPASSTRAPPSAARCAAATMPPRLGITALRMIWVREKLSVTGAILKSLRVVAREADDVGMGREPDAAARLGVADQILQHPHARAVARVMRVHGELK